LGPSGAGITFGGGALNGGGSNLGNLEDNTIDTGINSDDVNCDYLGTCYDVSVHCKDTRIVVNVNTNRAFSGRIYALGRSETCNVDVINSDTFRLDLTMAGQDCNTQSASGVYTNTVVVQRHSVVMTKTDKIYKVRCTYDTSSKNITFGMMPIRDVSKRSVANEVGAGMSLSREIIVLDFGDEATSPYDFDRTTKRPGGNNTDYKVDAVDWPTTVEEVFATTAAESCPTKTSVLVLSVICALLLIIYMCTMFYFCVRKVILQNQKEREVRTTTIFRG